MIVPVHGNRHIAIDRIRDGTIVVFTYLGIEGLSMISTRKAGRNERTLLE